MCQKNRKKTKKQTEKQKQTVSPTDAGSHLGIPILPKEHFMTRTTNNNYHFTPSTCLAGSGTTNKENQSTDEPRNSIQSGDTTSPDTSSATRSDRLPDQTKSLKHGPRNHKEKSAPCLQLSN